MKTLIFFLTTVLCTNAFAACKPRDLKGDWDLFVTRTHTNTIQFCQLQVSKTGTITGVCRSEVEATDWPIYSGQITLLPDCSGEAYIDFHTHSIAGGSQWGDAPTQSAMRLRMNLGHDTISGVMTENTGDYAGVQFVKH